MEATSRIPRNIQRKNQENLEFRARWMASTLKELDPESQLRVAGQYAIYGIELPYRQLLKEKQTKTPQYRQGQAPKENVKGYSASHKAQPQYL
ncbi:hypothetical protein GOV11_03690 [Candidatus Woesearchaeota archaeon]|nr:hypothetical protein [Candidatus Woesearchaeota archaeon]